MPESREDSVYLAKLAEQAERYEGELAHFHPRGRVLTPLCRDGREHEACRVLRPRAHR